MANKNNNESKIPKWITPKRIYYIFIMIIFTIFIIINRCEVLEFTFFNDFDGYNFIFIIWIILLLLPIFGAIDILGVKVNHAFDGAAVAAAAAAAAQDPQVNIEQTKDNFEEATRGDNNGE